MKKEYLYAGSWLDETGKCGGGIRVYQRDSDTGDLEQISVYREDLAAGYICISANKKYLYAVDEIKRKPDCVNTEGCIWAFEIREDGELKELNSISTCGVFPNYIALSCDGKMLYAVNYGSEDIVVRSCLDENGDYCLRNVYEESSMIAVSLQDDGSLGAISDLKVFEGEPSGFYRWFQSSPHPHCIGTDPSGKMALVADRGCDDVVTCRIDTSAGKFYDFHHYKTERGIGPRNCVFHPKLPYVYVAGEVQPFVICYRYSAETAELEKVGQYLTADEGLIFETGKEFFDCAHPSDIRLHPNGRFLYVANRGPDTIACFAVENDGTLTHLQDVLSGGVMPWSFAFNQDGRNLYAGNKVSGDITLFSVDEQGIPHSLRKKKAAARVVCVKSLSIS